MKNFISMFLMTSLLLGGMTFTIGKMSVCAASKTGLKQHSKTGASFRQRQKQTCRHRPGFCSDHGQFHLRRRLFPW